MSEYIIDETTLTGLANATRSLTNMTTGIKIGQLASIVNGAVDNMFMPPLKYARTSIKSCTDNKAKLIGAQAFMSCASLSYISASQCRFIEDQAFANCTSLTSVFFPNVEQIGDSAFYNCKLAQFVSPVKRLGQNAFYSCASLTQVSLSSVTEMPVHAFAACSSLSSVYAPNVSVIKNEAFTECISLVSVSFPNCITVEMGAFSGAHLLSAYFPRCKDIRASAFCAGWTPSGTTETPDDPSILTATFPECSIVGSCAFGYQTKLSLVSFPKCEQIQSEAFIQCTALEQVNFPACTSVGARAFEGCSNLSTISFPNCTVTGSSAFKKCKLIYPEFPKLSQIGTETFALCSSLSVIELGASQISFLAMPGYFKTCRTFAYGTVAGIRMLNLTAVAVLPSSDIFEGCTSIPFIYVPRSLQQSFISHSQWSYFASRIVVTVTN